MKTEKKTIQMDKIEILLKKCCEMSGSSITDLRKKTRKREVVMARQRAMYILKEYSTLSWNKIGLIVAGLNHATAYYAHNNVIVLMESDHKYKAQVEEIEKFTNEFCLTGNSPDENKPEANKEAEPAKEVKYNYHAEVKKHQELAENRLQKIRLLEQTISEQTNHIQDLAFRLRAAEGEARLFKRKMEYAQRPGRILAGE